MFRPRKPVAPVMNAMRAGTGGAKRSAQGARQLDRLGRVENRKSSRGRWAAPKRRSGLTALHGRPRGIRTSNTLPHGQARCRRVPTRRGPEGSRGRRRARRPARSPTDFVVKNGFEEARCHLRRHPGPVVRDAPQTTSSPALSVSTANLARCRSGRIGGVHDQVPHHAEGEIVRAAEDWRKLREVERTKAPPPARASSQERRAPPHLVIQDRAMPRTARTRRARGRRRSRTMAMTRPMPSWWWPARCPRRIRGRARGRADRAGDPRGGARRCC